LGFESPWWAAASCPSGLALLLPGRRLSFWRAWSGGGSRSGPQGGCAANGLRVEGGSEGWRLQRLVGAGVAATPRRGGRLVGHRWRGVARRLYVYGPALASGSLPLGLGAVVGCSLQVVVMCRLQGDGVAGSARHGNSEEAKKGRLTHDTSWQVSGFVYWR